MKKLIEKNLFVILPFVLVLFFSLIYVLNQTKSDDEFYRTITIQHGETIWGIAERYSQNMDEQIAFINWVQEKNSISVNQFKAGEELTIPVKKEADNTLLLANGK